MSWGKNTSSIYAKTGTAAHKVNELCLLNDLPAAHYLGTSIEVEGTTIEVDEKMVEGCQLFLDTIEADRPEGPCEEYTEQWMDCSWIYKPDYDFLGPVPEGFTTEMGGTADYRISIFCGLLRVYDYKNGEGDIVEIVHNTQFLGYILGSLGPDNLDQIEKIEAILVQPHGFHPDGPVRRWQTTPEEVYAWMDETLIPGVKATEDPDAPLLPGPWCRFCNGGADCPAIRNKSYIAAREAFVESGATGQLTANRIRTVDLTRLTGKQIADLLIATEELGILRKAAESRMDELTRKGMGDPRFAIGRGRGSKKWNKPDTVIMAELKRRKLDPQLHKLLTPPQALKLTDWDSIKDLIDIHYKESLVRNENADPDNGKVFLE
jgi:hypothetical protein